MTNLYGPLLKCLVAGLAMLCCFSLNIKAQQAPLISFQGQLTNQAGEPLNPTAPLTLVFRFYENPVGGTVLWEEGQPNISVIGGRFGVLLGARNKFTGSVDFSHTLYLGITIDDGDQATADVEMRPRQAVIPAIFATNSGNAAKLAGRDWSDILVNGNDPTMAKIKAERVDLTKLEALETRVGALAEELKTVKRDYPPVGTIVPFGGSLSSLPSGWKLCDGTPLSRERYETLFAAIDYFWGKDTLKDTLNRNFFNLPDLQGRFLRGVGGDTNVDPEKENREPSKPGGNSNNNVGSIQGDATKRPKIPFVTNEEPDHSHKSPTNAGGAGSFEVPAESRNVDYASAADTQGAGHHGHTIVGGGDAETRPKNAYVYWIIRVE